MFVKKLVHFKYMGQCKAQLCVMSSVGEKERLANSKVLKELACCADAYSKFTTLECKDMGKEDMKEFHAWMDEECKECRTVLDGELMTFRQHVSAQLAAMLKQAAEECKDISKGKPGGRSWRSTVQTPGLKSLLAVSKPELLTVGFANKLKSAIGAVNEAVLSCLAVRSPECRTEWGRAIPCFLVQCSVLSRGLLVRKAIAPHRRGVSDQ